MERPTEQQCELGAINRTRTMQRWGKRLRRGKDRVKTDHRGSLIGCTGFIHDTQLPLLYVCPSTTETTNDLYYFRWYGIVTSLSNVFDSTRTGGGPGGYPHHQPLKQCGSVRLSALDRQFHKIK